MPLTDIEKRLSEYSLAMGNTAQSGANQLLGNIGQISMLPNLSPEVQQQLMDQYTRSMNLGQTMLGQQFNTTVGDINAGMTGRGLRGSSAQGRAVGGATSGLLNSLLGLHTESANTMDNAILQLRQALMADQLQRYMAQSGLVSSLSGIPTQGYGNVINAETERYKADQAAAAQKQGGLMGALAGIGGGIFNVATGGLGGSLMGILGGLGGGGLGASDFLGLNTNPQFTPQYSTGTPYSGMLNPTGFGIGTRKTGSLSPTGFGI